ncbi:MAG: hypothetical protein ACREIP_18475 [Alphaproteobacteria bacterium]
MNRYFSGCTLAVGTTILALGLVATPAAADTYIYNYYSEPGTAAPYYTPARRTYYRAPVYSTPPNTTYFYGPTTSPYMPPSSALYYNPPAAYYVPPGLSITTPLGTYAPFYGGYSPYSSPDTHDPYRVTPTR